MRIALDRCSGEGADVKENLFDVQSVKPSRKTAAIFIGVFYVVLASKTFALSGEEMTSYCATNACGGYFIGAFDGLRIAGAVGSEKQRKVAAICAPSEVTNEQVVDVALAYLERHRELGHLSAANLALRAWREQWPCGE